MEIIFAGTGSGKTSLQRFHSAFIIKQNDFSLLVDAGDGISKALLAIGEDVNQIDSIIFSHYHADHFAGISSLLTQMKLLKRSKPLTIFTHHLLKEALTSFLNYSYLFKEAFEFGFAITGFEFDKKKEINSSLKFTAKRNNHINAAKYPERYDNVKFVSSGFLFETGDEKVFYTGDVNDAADLYLFDSNDIVITETTHVKHEEIEKYVEDSNPDKIILTHISDDDEKILMNWRAKLSKEIKNKIIIAYDGLKIQ